MRKITLLSLLAASITGGTAEAGDFIVSTQDAPHEYYICNSGVSAKGNFCKLYSDNNGEGLTHTTTFSEGAKFKIEAGTEEGHYYIYCISNSKYVTYSDVTSGAGKVTFVESKDDAQQWRIVEESEGSETYDILPLEDVNCTDGHGKLGWNWHGGLTANNKLGFYGNTDTNSSWTFMSNPHTVTYNLQYNGTTFESKTFTLDTGEAYPAAPTSNYFIEYSSGRPEGTTQSSTDESFNLQYVESQDNPVKATTIVNGAFAEGTEWYTINLPSNTSGSWTVMLNGNGDTFSSSTFDNMYNGRDWFCFVGDPANGYDIYNYAYGVDKPLRIGTSCPTIKTENGTTESKWIVFRNGSSTNIKAKALDGKNWNQLGGAGSGNFGFWAGGGSGLRLMTSVETAKNYVDKTNFPAKVGNYIGGYAEGTKNNLMQIAEQSGVSQELRNAVAAAADVPQAGKYYRIFNVFLTQSDNHDGMLGTFDGKAYCSNETNAEAGKIWQIIPVNGGYQFYNVNTKTYLGNTAYGSGSQTPMSTTAATYAITYNGEGKNTFQQSGGRPVEVENNYLNGWENGDKSRWFIVEATVHEADLNTAVGSYYATAYLPFAVEATGTTKLYTAKQNADDTNVVDAVETTTVPAEQGFIIEGTEGTVTLNIVSNATAIEGNILTGTLQDKTIEDKTSFYVFSGNEDGTVGFYRPSSTTLAANKAYIDESAAASDVAGFVLNFGGTQTGIQGAATIEGNNAAQPVYDLSGRRVVNPARGIYIQGGKKILVK